jgi:hypothetical protein
MKHSDRKPFWFGWNQATRHLRFPVEIIHDDRMIHSELVKRSKTVMQMQPLHDADTLDSWGFCKSSGDMHFVFHTCEYAPDFHVHVYPVRQCSGIFVNYTRPCVVFDIEHAAFHTGASTADFVLGIVAKSASQHNLSVDDLRWKHAFIWFHPGRPAQIVVILQDDRVIWASQVADLDQVEVGPPNGRYEAGTDGSTWSISFNYKGLESNSSTTFRRVSEPSPSGLTFHCTVGGRVGCVVTNDVHASDQYSAIKEWAVCAVQIA